MPVTERFFPAASLTGSAGVIAAPFQFIVSGEEVLLVEIINLAIGTTVVVSGRFLKSDTREIQVFEYRYVPAVAGPAQYSLEALGPGALLNLLVRREGSVVAAGLTWVRLHIARGRPQKLALTFQPAILLGTMLGGYINERAWLVWPGSPIRSPLEGPGLTRQVTGTAPAAGAEILQAVPAGRVWRICTFFATLVTSAVVANRTPALQVDNGIGAALFRIAANFNQVASTTMRYVWGVSLPDVTVGAIPTVTSAWPLETRLSPSWNIGTVTANRDAGDQWSAPELIVEEWIAG